MARLGLGGFGRVGPAVLAHDLLELAGRGVAGKPHEVLLELWGGHPRDGPHLGVGELARLEGGPQAGQPVQGTADPYLLASRPEARAYPPVEPVGTRAQPSSRPGTATVELADEQHEGGTRRH